MIFFFFYKWWYVKLEVEGLTRKIDFLPEVAWNIPTATFSFFDAWCLPPGQKNEIARASRFYLFLFARMQRNSCIHQTCRSFDRCPLPCNSRSMMNSKYRDVDTFHAARVQCFIDFPFNFHFLWSSLLFARGRESSGARYIAQRAHLHNAVYCLNFFTDIQLFSRFTSTSI